MNFLIKTIIGGIVNWLSNGGTGHKIGTAVTDGAAILTLAPLAYWFITHKDEIAVSMTWGQLGLFGLLCFFVLKIAHYTRFGNPVNRSGPGTDIS